LSRLFPCIASTSTPNPSFMRVVACLSALITIDLRGTPPVSRRKFLQSPHRSSPIDRLPTFISYQDRYQDSETHISPSSPPSTSYTSAIFCLCRFFAGLAFLPDKAHDLDGRNATRQRYPFGIAYLSATTIDNAVSVMDKLLITCCFVSIACALGSWSQTTTEATISLGPDVVEEYATTDAGEAKSDPVSSCSVSALTV
jgi:hypothetical protein